MKQSKLVKIISFIYNQQPLYYTTFINHIISVEFFRQNTNVFNQNCFVTGKDVSSTKPFNIYLFKSQGKEHFNNLLSLLTPLIFFFQHCTKVPLKTFSIVMLSGEELLQVFKMKSIGVDKFHFRSLYSTTQKERIKAIYFS